MEKGKRNIIRGGEDRGAMKEHGNDRGQLFRCILEILKLAQAYTCMHILIPGLD